MENNCPETLLNFYPIKCTYLGISLFQFYLLWVRKLSLKSGQLEVSGSVYIICILLECRIVSCRFVEPRLSRLPVTCKCLAKPGWLICKYNAQTNRVCRLGSFDVEHVLEKNMHYLKRFPEMLSVRKCDVNVLGLPESKQHHGRNSRLWL